MTEFPQMDSGLAVPMFNQGDYLIAYLNKAMAFLTVVASSRFPSTNNQLRTSSNPRKHAIIQDGRVTMQLSCKEARQEYAATWLRPRNAAWFKEKAMLAEAHDPTEDLDTYDYDCDDVSNAKAILIDNLSNYGLDVILEVVHIVLWYLDSECLKHMTGNRSRLMNFVSTFLGTVRFRNDQIEKVMGYGDYQPGKKNTCFIWNLEDVDLLSGSRDTNLYTISLDDMIKTSPIYLLSKASKTKSWLWHRQLSHINFGTLNKLAKDGLARGIPKLKFKKDHLCSACALGKSKKSFHQPKAKDSNQEKLYLLHTNLYGPMRMESINGKSISW
ncbi:retrovirus-related pol polyprotein from transposon TNT 1-94 [Tanacetum coccineum]